MRSLEIFKRRFVLQLLLWCILLVLPTGKMVHASAPKVSVEITPDTCRIGDIVTYRLSVLRPSTVSVAYPTESDTIFAPFEITEIKKQSGPVDEGLEQDELEYYLMAFETGELPVPAIALNYLEDKTDAEPQMVEVGGKLIVVQSSLDSAAQAMADIKPIKSAPFPVLLALGVLVALVALGGLAYWGYQKYRTRPEKPAEVIEEVIEPYDWAKEKLEDLKTFELSDQPSFKQYYSRLSDIIREYIERYYNQPALEQLTYEIIQSLRDKSQKEDCLNIQDVLEKSDMVKFAKYYPSQQEARQSLNLAYKVIESSKPQPLPPSEAASSGENVKEPSALTNEEKS